MGLAKTVEPGSPSGVLVYVKRERYTMEFRFERIMGEKLNLLNYQSKKKINSIIENAIAYCMYQHEKGKLVFENKSHFLSRLKKDDKDTIVITLMRKYREMTRALAHAYDCCRAEVMRIALEVYFSHMENRENRNKDQKNYYSTPQLRVEEVYFSFLKPYIHKTTYTNPLFRDTS